MALRPEQIVTKLTFLQASGLEMKLFWKHFVTSFLSADIQGSNVTELIPLRQLDSKK
jgi:hypothetical protein